MRASNDRLTILSGAEQSALYELPDFDYDQRLEFLVLTNPEQELMINRGHLAAKVYCALQIGYFKAKQMFFRFTWDEADPEDVAFILQQYFLEETLDKKTITKQEHYNQCNVIASLFGYSIWSSDFEQQAYQQTEKIIFRDTKPQFIVMELLSFFRKEKIIRPRYTTLQVIVSRALNNERNRLSRMLSESLSDNEIFALQKLLLEENTLSGLAALKQDAKDFKARMMTAEREKLATIKPLYQIAKILLPKLKLSKQNIHYYSSLAQYYSIHDLRKRLKPEQTYLYLLCYIWQRYQQLNDNLIDSFCYHLGQFDEETKEKAKVEFSQHAVSQQNEWIVMKRLAHFFVDDHLSDDTRFGVVREHVFRIVSRDELRSKVGNPDEKPRKEIDFKWRIIDKLGQRFKNHLRPLVMVLDFSSTIPNSPWLAAIEWFRNIFSQQQSLHQRLFSECPAGTIPKRLRSYLLENNSGDNKNEKIQADRYEFWIYRQIRKRFKAGELYLEDSIHHRSLNHELVSLSEMDSQIQQLDIPALREPIEKQLDNSFAELHTLWMDFNNELSQGKLKHLRYDESTKTLHIKKSKEDADEELQHHFYQQLPLCDITDVLQFVNERCHYQMAFNHIQPRYAKQNTNGNYLNATIIAQAMNHGNLNMAEISDISYDILQDNYKSRIRLPTLKAGNDLISNDIANMPIFPYYSFDLEILYGGVDGQKFEVDTPTTKARYSRKYFKKGKGVVAYTMLANHIPLQVELIGAHEHESYFVFDIWHNNTSEVVPDVITGDMHCINKANFALMHWFGGKLFPRFTDIEAQRNHLYTGCDLSEYKDCLIQPIGQINRQLIEDEWPNLQRIIATLGLKEITQSILIKKLCTYSQENRTRKALFEYDKLIRSIHTLKYFRDVKIQRDTHRSQNRIESYHQLRAAIAQAYGRKQLTGMTDTAIEISNQCGRFVANAIIHYNSAILSKLREKYEEEDNQKALAILKKISPVAWRHIHFQGYLTFSDSVVIDLDAIIEKLILK
jgi:TnpA family transposase